MDRFLREFPCRKKEIDFLKTLYCEWDSFTPGNLFISGLHAVGKTSVVKRFLECMDANFIFINCIECYTPKLLLDPILRVILPDFHQERQCDTLLELIHCLKVASKDKHIGKKLTVLVFDGVEHLSQLGKHYFEALLSLQEATQIKTLSVIFISHLLPSKFDGQNLIDFTLYFRQYTKDEMLKILLLEQPSDCSEKFYSNYLGAALSVFHHATRDLSEMRLLVRECYKKYLEPIGQGVQQEDSAALWRHVAPHLRAAVASVYSGVTPRDLKNGAGKENRVGHVAAFDLPFYSKYFLIAAYLASHNSARHDRRLFVAAKQGRGKRADRKPASQRDAATDLIGPRQFSIDRLLAIFYAIMEDKASLTANLMSEITTLVELRLLTRIGDVCLDKPKYKCSVGLACVDSVARTVGFNVKKYLL